MDGWRPRADSDGVVYIPGSRYISMLEISDSGHATVIGNLTGQGELQGHTVVAVGPRPGELCVGHSSHVYIVNITTDSILRRLARPPGLRKVDSLAVLPTGQILVSDRDGQIAWYRSVSESAILLADTPDSGRRVLMVGNVNLFLVAPHFGSQLFVMDYEGIWHTVDALNGKDGVWVPGITDMAVWDNCVWVGNDEGSLVLLCPV